MAAHGVLIRRVITWVGAYWAGGGEALHGENQPPSRPGNIGLSGFGKIIDMGGLLRSVGLPHVLSACTNASGCLSILL